MEVIGVERLVSQSPLPVQELLSTAARSGHALVVSYLMQCGAYVDVDAVVAAFDTPRIDVFQALVNGGFDINIKLRHTGNILFLSVGHVDILTWVLARGANPNRGRSGMLSALDLAVMKSSAEAVQLLIQHGANVKNTNALKTAAYYHYGTLEMTPLLLEAGADVNEIPDYEEMDGEREQGLGTALHEAALGGQLKALELSLEKGADPALKNTMGTARDLAREKEHVVVVEVLKRKSRV